MYLFCTLRWECRPHRTYGRGPEPQAGSDMVEAQEIIVPLVNTQNNDADFFTKPLPPKRFKFLRRRIMNMGNDETLVARSFARGR